MTNAFVDTAKLVTDPLTGRWLQQSISRYFLRCGCGGRSRRSFLGSRLLIARLWPGGSIRVAQNDRQSVPAGADNYDLRVGRLRKLKCRLDAPPLQVGVGDPLADDLLKFVYAFRLDLLSLGLPYLARNPEFVLFRNVILLDFAIDCSDHGSRQFDAEDEGVDEVEHGVERDTVRSVVLSPRFPHAPSSSRPAWPPHARGSCSEFPRVLSSKHPRQCILR